MLKRRSELDFATEPVRAEPGGELGREDLDDDFAAERDLLCGEDPAHPAATQLSVEPVLAGDGRLEAGQEVGHPWFTGGCHSGKIYGVSPSMRGGTALRSR